MEREYVVGFAINGLDVLLIRKNRPDWQAGKLNGVGGKIEPGEFPIEAMVREFQEETGHLEADWDYLLELQTHVGPVHFFRLLIKDRGVFDEIALRGGTTDEAVGSYSIPELLFSNLMDSDGPKTLPNLPWLLALALYREYSYSPFLVSEIAAGKVAEK